MMKQMVQILNCEQKLYAITQYDEKKSGRIIEHGKLRRNKSF